MKEFKGKLKTMYYFSTCFVEYQTSTQSRQENKYSTDNQSVPFMDNGAGHITDRGTKGAQGCNNTQSKLPEIRKHQGWHHYTHRSAQTVAEMITVKEIFDGIDPQTKWIFDAAKISLKRKAKSCWAKSKKLL